MKIFKIRFIEGYWKNVKKQSKLYIVLFSSLVIAALVWVGWLRDSGNNRIRQVILISIDTCRADYFDCYGYKDKTTPNISALAAEGVLFENVVSPVPLTLPAHSSLMTSAIPPFHGVRENKNYQLGNSNLTLAEILREQGYQTSAIIGSFVLDPIFGLDQGFDNYNADFEEPVGGELWNERRGEEVSRLACQWLQQNQEEDFFLFLHYFDPHRSYNPPEPFASEYADNLYAGEIAYVDHCLGQVIDTLKNLGLYESALIIITGDHGEMLGEHSEDTHGYFVYQSALKVPLIMKSPRNDIPRRITNLVGLIDIAPTILSCLEKDVPDEFQGIDLSDFLYKKDFSLPSRNFFAESVTPLLYQCGPLYAIVTDDWKYIQAPQEELYNLINDPGENTNLATQEKTRLRKLKKHLLEILSDQSYVDRTDNVLEPDQMALHILESLGYVAGKTTGEIEYDSTAIDPKDRILLHNQFVSLNILAAHKEFDKAKELGLEIIRKFPEFPDTYFTLGYIMFDQKDFTQAIDFFTKSVQYKPEDSSYRLSLGSALALAGKYEQAEQHYRDALKINPDFFEAHNYLAAILALRGKTEQAIQHFREATRLKPDTFDVQYNLAVTLAAQGKFDEAITHYQLALRISPQNIMVLRNLVYTFTVLGKQDEALKCLKQVLEINPKDAKVHFMFGEALIATGKIETAISQYLQSLQLNPKNQKLHVKVGKLLTRQKKYDQAIEHYQQSLQLEPDQPEAYIKLAEISYVQNHLDKALEYWYAALHLHADWPAVLNNIAAIRANLAYESLSDPNEAVKLALRACELTEFKQPGLLDTLSFSYASAGDFTQAAETAKKALDLAVEAKQETLAKKIRQKLEYYERGQPYPEQTTTPQNTSTQNP